ncbi:DUF6950 family protein [Halodurantibacterium flavum]|uniref:DUF6950 family protein n=1 Tax=Halodurantibacterium flavum TaxID=1382802 RepID=A0ABW4S884_9RHOB
MRREGWEIRLAEALTAAAHRPFRWGVHDCATWAFDLRAGLRGEASPADAWRGRYKTPIGAVRVMKRLGWPSLPAAGIALLGQPLPHVLLAQRGDIVFSAEAFGICEGAQVAFVAPDGLRRLRLRDCAMAWRV